MGEAARIGLKLAFIGSKTTGHRRPSERTYVTSLAARRKRRGSGGAAARSIQDHAGDQNDLAVAVGRQGRLRGSGGVPLDTITKAILAGSPNLGYTARASPIPKPRVGGSSPSGGTFNFSQTR